MSRRYEESEFVFCDLQNVFRYIRRDDEAAAKRFLEAAYDSFEFLAANSASGRPVLNSVSKAFGRGASRVFAVI